MPLFLPTMYLLISGFLVATLFGHTLHWAIHQKWAGKLYKAHMVHHELLYPVSDFLSDDYRYPPGKDNTAVTFWLFAIPFLAAPLVLAFYSVVPLYAVFLYYAVVGGFGWLDNYFHDSFHIRNHFLKKYAYFRHLTDLHYQHHVDMQKNFGIFLFWWDKAFSSFKQA